MTSSSYHYYIMAFRHPDFKEFVCPHIMTNKKEEIEEIKAYTEKHILAPVFIAEFPYFPSQSEITKFTRDLEHRYPIIT